MDKVRSKDDNGRKDYKRGSKKIKQYNYSDPEVQKGMSDMIKAWEKNNKVKKFGTSMNRKLFGDIVPIKETKVNGW